MLQEAMASLDQGGGNGGDGMGLPDMSPEEMEQMKQLMSQLGENGDFQEYLDKILGQMMSKEVLHEPMKQIDLKYQEFFREGGTFTAEEDAQFHRQHEYVRRILQEYEKPEPNSDAVAQLMQEMQECGQPPPQIVKELAGALGGSEGLQNIPGLAGVDPNDPNAQCCVQ